MSEEIIDKKSQKELLPLILMAVLIIGLALLCVFTPNIYLFKKIAEHTKELMLMYLVLGLVFLIFRQEKLMFITFIGCAVLALHLRKSTGSSLVKPVDLKAPSFQIVQFDLDNAEGDKDMVISSILESGSDLVALQEVNPMWNTLLQEKISFEYPYNKSLVSIDPYGMALYSKYPFELVDTFMYEEVPNIQAVIKMDSIKKKVGVIYSLTTPPTNAKHYKNLNNHLKLISSKAQTFNIPLITLGDYNIVPYSSELQSFVDKSGLEISNRSYMPSYPNTADKFFYQPMKHILYSKELQCLDLKGHKNKNDSHFGLQGTYQFKN